MEIRRNDPCPCGNGKKYKKCCMLKENMIKLQQMKQNRFYDLKNHMVLRLREFLAANLSYQEESILKETFRTRLNVNISDNQVTPYVTFWLLFFHEFENGQRGVEWYYDEVGKSLANEEKELIEKWITLVPKLIKTVDYNEEGKVVMDLFTKETYLMPYSETVQTVRPWEISFCLLEPFEKGYYINGVTTWTAPEVADTVLTEIHNLISNTEKSYTQVVRHFYPELLSLLIRDSQQSKSSQITYEKLIYQLTNKDKVIQSLFNNKDFVVDEWEENKGNMMWVGDWYRYEDSELENPIYIAESYGEITVESDQLVFNGYRDEKITEFETWMEQLAEVSSLSEREEIVYTIPNCDTYETYFNILADDTPQQFAYYAQTRLRWSDLNSSILRQNSVSPREMVEKGQIEELDSFLQKLEYHSFRTLKGSTPITEDFNSIRKELGLPLSPFVTNCETRVSSIERCERPDQVVTNLEAELPYLTQLGFTPETAQMFYGQDILDFFQEKTEGKSKGTINKYETGLKHLVDYLASCTDKVNAWNECTVEFWEHLIVYKFLDLNFEVTNSQAKAFMSTLYTFIRYLDKKYNTDFAQTVKILLNENEEYILQALSFLNSHNQFNLKGYTDNITGCFEILSTSTKDMSVVSINDESMKEHNIALPAKEIAQLHNGMLFKGTIAKKSNKWEIVGLERVYPKNAKPFIQPHELVLV